MEYGLIGEKLGHSYSANIHGKFGKYAYELRELPDDALDAFLRERNFCGINVTIPYKQRVIPYLDWIDPNAKRIGAVNTIVNREGKLYGYNTDYAGLMQVIQKAGHDLHHKKVLILGTGGTSRTACAVCSDLGAASVYRLSRKEGISSKDDLSGAETITYSEALQKHTDADLILNTTPCGMYPNLAEQPLDLTAFQNLKGVVDVIYNPLRTRLLLQAEELGIKADGGLMMLVYQAVAAYALFTGKSYPDEAAERILHDLRRDQESIVLIGMPGSGKSTIGKLLAAKLQMEFVDTDEWIVSREGRSIPAIFETDGEPYFRSLEESVSTELAKKNRLVIATGGGFVLNPVCEKNMKAYGRLVLLDRDVDAIIPTDDRPLANEREKIAKLYEERMPRYLQCADIVVKVNGTCDQVADEIAKQLLIESNGDH